MDKQFLVVHNNAFIRMSMNVVVSGISFNEFMVKLKHADHSWAKDLKDEI